MIRECLAPCPRNIFTEKRCSPIGPWIILERFPIQCWRQNEFISTEFSREYFRRMRCPIRLDSPPRLRWKTGVFLLDAPRVRKPAAVEKLFSTPASPDTRKFSPIQVTLDKLSASPIPTLEMSAQMRTTKKLRVLI